MSSRLLIVDASFLVDLFLGEERLGAHINGFELHAPVSVDAEFVHALRRQWLAGLITDVDASNAIALFSSGHAARIQYID